MASTKLITEWLIVERPPRCSPNSLELRQSLLRSNGKQSWCQYWAVQCLINEQPRNAYIYTRSIHSFMKHLASFNMCSIKLFVGFCLESAIFTCLTTFKLGQIIFDVGNDLAPSESSIPFAKSFLFGLLNIACSTPLAKKERARQ